ALALAAAPPFLPLAFGSPSFWAALALAFWAAERLSAARRVEATQPSVPLAWSDCSKRQPEIMLTLPGFTLTVPSQVWGSLSVRPKRRRTPASLANAGVAARARKRKAVERERDFMGES